MSKFEIINAEIKSNTYNKKKCILLHFKNNQFFIQTFKDHKAQDKARLLDLDNEELKINRKITYIYDNILFEELLGNKIRENIKKNFYLIDYNLVTLKEIISKITIDNSNPKPLYISNYY